MSQRTFRTLASGKTRIGIAVVTDSPTGLGSKPGLEDEIQSAMRYSDDGPGFEVDNINTIEDLEIEEMYPSYFGDDKLYSLPLEDETGIYIESEFPQMIQWQIESISDVIGQVTGVNVKYYTIGPSTTTEGRFGAPRPRAKSRIGVAVVTDKPIGIEKDPSVVQEIKDNMLMSSVNAQPSTVETIESGSTDGMSSGYFGTNEMDPLQIQNEKGAFMTFKEPAFTNEQLESMLTVISETTGRETDYFTVGTL